MKEQRRPFLHHLTQITAKENALLMQEIKKDEVMDAIWALDRNKVPKTDGFPISFYCSYCL